MEFWKMNGAGNDFIIIQKLKLFKKFNPSTILPPTPILCHFPPPIYPCCATVPVPID